MLFTDTSANMKSKEPAGKVGCGNDVCLAFGDVDSLGVSELAAELSLLGQSESRMAARKAKLLAAISRLSSSGDAQQLVTSELLVSRREAKKEVETANQLESLPETSGALASGDITAGHAKLIARTSSGGKIVEGELLDKAKTQQFDDFVKTVRKHQNQQADKAGESVLERQRKKRFAQAFESPDNGMLVLRAEFDQITGARVMTALADKERQMYYREDPKDRPTPQQRRADALAELICEQTLTSGGKGRSRLGTNLLVIADYCTIKQQLDNLRLANGSPIMEQSFRELAVEANILPAVFNNETQRLWLGRSQRTASDAQRIALTARDQHCIGCGTDPLWCRAHHIRFWSHGGETNFDNLTLVCDRCHHKIHDDGWQITQNPTTRKLELKPPTPRYQHHRSTKQPPQRNKPKPATKPSSIPQLK